MSDESDNLLYVSSQFYKALDEMDWKINPESIANKIKQLEFGLPNEDEFSFLAAWMGNCKLIHKLDQVQIPTDSRKKYLVPDFIAILNYNGVETPFLIEVKTTQRMFLSWRKDYYSAMKSYSDKLGIPLLIAWKIRPFGTWVLTDAANFEIVENKYRLTIEKAMKENFMGILLGDFNFVFHEKFKLVFNFKKIKKVKEATQPSGVKETQWNTIVEEVYFITSKGVKTMKIHGPLSAAFFCANQTVITEDFEKNVIQSFSQVRESFQSAHQMMLAFMKVANNNQKIKWKEVLRNGKFKINFQEFVAACNLGIDEGIIQYRFDQIPNNFPTYITQSGFK